MIAHVLSYIQMADTAEDIVEKWRHNVPPNVPKEDVETVVDAYFPLTHRFSSGGSHWLMLNDPVLAVAAELGLLTGTIGGKITFSHVKGRTVKAYQVKMLLDAVKIKEEFDALTEEEKKNLLKPRER